MPIVLNNCAPLKQFRKFDAYRIGTAIPLCLSQSMESYMARYMGEASQARMTIFRSSR